MRVILWDKIGPVPEDNSEVILWKEYGSENFLASIPDFVEMNAERLRSAYLNFIYDLGQKKVSGKKIVEHFRLDDGFSLWWMSRIVEKSPFKSPEIYDCISLLALEEILREIKPTHLSLFTANINLAEAVCLLCDSLGIQVHNEKVCCLGKVFRTCARSLFSPLKGIAYLIKYIWTRRRIIFCNKSLQYFGAPSVTFVSYFAHLDNQACLDGIFYSRQWGALPELVEKLGVKSNWIHHLITGGDAPSPGDASDIFETLNKYNQSKNFHTSLDHNLDFRGLLKVVSLWLRLNFISLRLRNVRSAFAPKGYDVNFWPIMRDEWRSSTRGNTLLGGLLFLQRFETALRGMPAQKLGFYLCENQAWEKALLHVWKKYGHKTIIGVVHSSVPFWHLYYHDDPRTLTCDEAERFPTPDFVAVNGPVAHASFILSGYPESKIKNVEALRYLDINTATQKPLQKQANCVTNVLIVGDIHESSNQHIFKLIHEALPCLCSSYVFTYKPHPACQGDQMAGHGMKLKITNEPLSKLLQHYDVVVAGNSTSGALDASLSGVPVLVVLNGGSLNLSPLRGQRGAQFVSTSKEMAKALKEHKQFAKDEDFIYYWLNEEMPWWQDLLASELMNTYN